MLSDEITSISDNNITINIHKTPEDLVDPVSMDIITCPVCYTKDDRKNRKIYKSQLALTLLDSHPFTNLPLGDNIPREMTGAEFSEFVEEKLSEEREFTKLETFVNAILDKNIRSYSEPIVLDICDFYLVAKWKTVKIGGKTTYALSSQEREGNLKVKTSKSILEVACEAENFFMVLMILRAMIAKDLEDAIDKKTLDCLSFYVSRFALPELEKEILSLLRSWSGVKSIYGEFSGLDALALHNDSEVIEISDSGESSTWSTADETSRWNSLLATCSNDFFCYFLEVYSKLNLETIFMLGNMLIDMGCFEKLKMLLNSEQFIVFNNENISALADNVLENIRRYHCNYTDDEFKASLACLRIMTEKVNITQNLYHLFKAIILQYGGLNQFETLFRTLSDNIKRKILELAIEKHEYNVFEALLMETPALLLLKDENEAMLIELILHSEMLEWVYSLFQSGILASDGSVNVKNNLLISEASPDGERVNVYFLVLEKNDDEIFQILITLGKGVSTLQDKQGNTLLLKAIQLQRWAIVEYLLHDNLIDLKLCNNKNHSILHELAMAGRYQLINELVKKDLVDIHILSTNGEDVIHVLNRRLDFYCQEFNRGAISADQFIQKTDVILNCLDSLLVMKSRYNHENNCITDYLSVCSMQNSLARSALAIHGMLYDNLPEYFNNIIDSCTDLFSRSILDLELKTIRAVMAYKQALDENINLKQQLPIKSSFLNDQPDSQYTEDPLFQAIFNGNKKAAWSAIQNGICVNFTYRRLSQYLTLTHLSRDFDEPYRNIILTFNNLLVAKAKELRRENAMHKMNRPKQESVKHYRDSHWAAPTDGSNISQNGTLEPPKKRTKIEVTPRG